LKTLEKSAENFCVNMAFLSKLQRIQRKEKEKWMVVKMPLLDCLVVAQKVSKAAFIVRFKAGVSNSNLSKCHISNKNFSVGCILIEFTNAWKLYDISLT
jgi:hypothetical protein